MMTSTRDPIITRSIGHYFAYRSVPVFVCSTFLVVSLDRGKARGIAGISAGAMAVVATCITHLVTTNGRAFLGLRRFPRGRRIGLLLLYLSTTALTIASAGLAIGLRRDLSPLVPKASEISLAAWTAIAVAVLAGWVLEASAGGQLSEATVEKSARELPQAALRMLWLKSRETDTEFRLALAVAIFENMQRPAWVRSIERRTGWLMGEGTFGLMQVRAKRPLSDIESVEIALETLLRGARVDHEEFPYGAPFVVALALYSTDPQYAGGVEEVYGLLGAAAARLEDTFNKLP